MNGGRSKVIVTFFFLLASDVVVSPPQASKSEVFSTAEDRGRVSLTGVEKFRLLDQFSSAHALTDYSDKKSVYLVAVNRKCIEGNEDRWLSRLPVEPNKVTLLITSTIGEEYPDYAGVKTPTLFDRWQFVAKAYDLRETGTFVEIDPNGDEVVRRDKVILDSPRRPECITKFMSEPQIDFSQQVITTFSAECLSCHMRYAQIDYFKSMADFQTWSKMIAKPWKYFACPPAEWTPISIHFGGEEGRILYAVSIIGCKMAHHIRQRTKPI